MKRELIKERVGDRAVDLMLDSGAFSAWNRGQVLHLGDYIKYVQEVKHLLYSYVVMDVLPFGKEAARTEEAVEACAKASYENLQVMRKEGLAPMPVFHQGERLYWLEKMVGEGETYIGLSTRKDLWTSAQKAWLDKCFRFLLDGGSGRPLVKTHGFGVTKFDLIRRYPWHTVDSTTWSLSPGYGKLSIPRRGKDGQPDYAKPPAGFICTDQIQGSASAARKHHGHLAAFNSSVILDWVIEYLKDHADVSISQVRNSPMYRRRVQLAYLEGLAQAKRSWLNQTRSKQKFDFRIMHATCLGHQFSRDLTIMHARNRLLSYYELKDKPLDTLAEYVSTGFLSGYKPRESYPPLSQTEAYKNFRAIRLIERLQGYENEPI